MGLVPDCGTRLQFVSLPRSLGTMREGLLASEAPASAAPRDVAPRSTPNRCPVQELPRASASCPVHPGHTSSRPSAEFRVRHLLRIPDGPPKVGEDAAHRLFSVSILLSALRCLLTYVALPILSPFLGAATGVGPFIGIPLALIALVFDVLGIRRFWLADHRWKWGVSAIYLVVMGFVTALLVIEVLKLAA